MTYFVQSDVLFFTIKNVLISFAEFGEMCRSKRRTWERHVF